jgi:hypothetical protein
MLGHAFGHLAEVLPDAMLTAAGEEESRAGRRFLNGGMGPVPAAFVSA